MKKYILFCLTTIVLIASLVIGVKNTNDYYHVMEDYNKKGNEVCANNGSYINSAGVDLCESFDTTKEYKVEVKEYVTDVDMYSKTFILNQENIEESSLDVMVQVCTILGEVLLVIISIESVFFVKDYKAKTKITKNNKDDIKSKCVLVALIPTIPLMLYGIAKGISPLLFVKNGLVLNIGATKFIINYCLSYVLLAVITGLIGLVVSTRNKKTVFNSLLIVLVMLVYKFGIYVATLLINSMFVVNYENLVIVGALNTCTLQTLLLLFTVVVGLVLYKVLPTVKEK